MDEKTRHLAQSRALRPATVARRPLRGFVRLARSAATIEGSRAAL